MKLKTVFIAHAVTEVIFGLGFLLVPSVLLGILGTSTDATGFVFAHIAGAVILSLAIISWLARDVPVGQLRDAMVDSMAGVAKDNLRSRAEGSEASAFGMHQADAGSDAYDRDFALSLLSQEQDALYEIDQALKRIELGTYGICEMSGKSISHARLEAIPFARFTVECQSQLEKQNKASRVRQSVTSLFGLTDEEGTESEEEEVKADESKE